MSAAPRPGGVLAIDHGSKKSGFAVTDGLRITAEPLDLYRGPGDGEGLLDHIAGLLGERTVTTLVVGVPLHADGTAGPRAKEVEAFIAHLTTRFPGLAIVRQDEHLTTKEAEQLLHEAGYRGADSRSRRDSWAALVILREWLVNDAGG